MFDILLFETKKLHNIWDTDCSFRLQMVLFSSGLCLHFRSKHSNIKVGWREGVTPMGGLGIHVPAWVMDQFAIFCPGYGSCFVNLALVMDLIYTHLPQSRLFQALI